jgi:hypothetical protein
MKIFHLEMLMARLDGAQQSRAVVQATNFEPRLFQTIFDGHASGRIGFRQYNLRSLSRRKTRFPLKHFSKINSRVRF